MPHSVIRGLTIMSAGIRKRAVVVAGRKTSVTVEDEFWSGVREIAACRKITISDFVGAIDRDRAGGNLSSSIRLAVLDHYRKEAGVSASQEGA